MIKDSQVKRLASPYPRPSLYSGPRQDLENKVAAMRKLVLVSGISIAIVAFFMFLIYAAQDLSVYALRGPWTLVIINLVLSAMGMIVVSWYGGLYTTAFRRTESRGRVIGVLVTLVPPLLILFDLIAQSVHPTMTYAFVILGYIYLGFCILPAIAAGLCFFRLKAALRKTYSIRMRMSGFNKKDLAIARLTTSSQEPSYTEIEPTPTNGRS